MFPFLREIPNKPPPPYPAHRQLQTMPPFPTDHRIKEIVFQRIDELYRTSKIEPKCQAQVTPSPNTLDASSSGSPSMSTTPITPTNATFVCSPTVLSPPNQQNVYEQIIIDCCEEIMQEIIDDSSGGAFRQPLAFFNPPNRLLCYQEHTLKRIFKLLNRPSNGRGEYFNDYNSGISSCLPPRMAQLSSSNRRKRDTVDEILIQELYEDEARWTNFSLEEEEIRISVNGDLEKLLIDDPSEMNDQSNATNNESSIGEQ